MTLIEKQKHKPKSPSNKNRVISKFMMITIVILTLFAGLQLFLKTFEQDQNDILSAYADGQFRVIQTESTLMYWSEDHEYVSVHRDGTYRISDGMRISEVYGKFSNTDQYLGQLGNGIYRLTDFEKIVDARVEEIWIGNREHRVHTGEIRFSQNDQYVAITGAGGYREEAEIQSADWYGIYRLSDGEQVVESDSYHMVFSSDSNYVIVQEGVYRLSDGERLFEEGYEFSPDSQLVYAQGGVYRLSDGEQLLSIENENDYQHATFSPNSDYLLLSGDGLYRLSDGLKIDTLAYNPVYAHPAYFIADGEYLIIPNDNETLSSDTCQTTNVVTTLFHTSSGEELFKWDWCSDYFISPNQDLIAIGGNGIYRLSEQQQLLEIIPTDLSGSLFNPSGQYATISNDGIYRLSDGVELFDLPNTRAYDVHFSPDEAFIAIENDGVYRMSDQQKLFTIEGYNGYFDDSGAYLTTFLGLSWSEPIIYRLSDGESFENAHLINAEKGILVVGDAIIVIDQTQQQDPLLFVYSDSNNTIVSRVLDESNDQYLINVMGELEWFDKTRLTPFYIP